MEHRHGKRKIVNIASTAELMSGKALSACIKDVSFGGIFVELPSDQLWAHAPIKLSFTIPQGQASNTFQWRGFVTRITDQGVGAMFESADPNEQAGLLALLKLADRKGIPTSVAC